MPDARGFSSCSPCPWSSSRKTSPPWASSRSCGGQALVFALAVLASALRGGESGRSPVYLLAAFFSCAVLPIAAFVSGEFGGADLSWLAAVSPVWAAVEIGGWRDLACSSFAAAAAAVLATREAAP